MDVIVPQQTIATPVIRKARLRDVGAMHDLINSYAARQVMLPKTPLQLYETLRDFSVAVDPANDSAVLGCGALHLYWENLAEIRSLAVLPDLRHARVGTRIMEELLDEARELELEQVFVFTYVSQFFSRFGFVQVEHHTLPLKVYNECFRCPKFNTCDEIAMVLRL